METEHQLGTKEEVIQKFTEVINNAKPGQIIQFAFQAPRGKKEELVTSRCRLFATNEILLRNLKCINEELAERKITQKGFIAMDADGEWYFYPEMPEQAADCWHVPTSDAVFLFKSYEDINVDWKDTLRVVY